MSVQGYYVGEIEYHLVRYVLSLLHSGFVMFDIGAHHGLFTLVAAYELKKRGWDGVIHSFEPSPKNFELLSFNVQQNELGKLVQLYPEAVGDQVQTSNLQINEMENSDNRVHFNGEVRSGGNSENVSIRPVNVTTVDTFIDSVPHIDLIKVDVQGAEPLVLTGAEKTIQTHRPVLVIEAVQEWPSTKRIREFLVDHNYRIFGVDAHGRLCAPNSPQAFVSWDWIGIPI
jgi:FkbM family methyltransferase